MRLFDVGIFHQILWSLTHGLGFHSTISGAGNFLLDHFSPSLVLLAPLFWLSGESPYFLSQIQVILLFGGAAAWLYLAEHLPGVPRSLRPHLSVATFLFIVSFDSLWHNILWGFHENALGFLCLSWAIALILTQPHTVLASKKSAGRRTTILFLLLVSALAKEIMLLNVAFVSIIWAFALLREGPKKINPPRRFSGRFSVKNPDKIPKPALFRLWFKNFAFPLFLIFFTLILVTGFIYFEKLSHPENKNYFVRYYSYLGTSLETFLSGLFWHPFRVFEKIGPGSILCYVWNVFAPWMFIPQLFLFQSLRKMVKTRNLAPLFPALWILVLTPSFFSALLADYPPLRDPHYHYVLELWPVLGLITVYALGRGGSKKWIYAWAVFSLLRMDADPIGDIREFWSEADRVAIVRTNLSRIPESAVIVADELAGPWVSGRVSVSRWPDTLLLPDHCPTYAVVKQGLTEFIESHCPHPECPPTLMRIMMSDCRSTARKAHFLWRKDEWAAFQFE